MTLTRTPNPRVRVRVGKVRKPYPNFQMVPLSMTFSDLWPTFQGHDNIQRPITRLIVSRVWSIQWFRFQWSWVTLNVDFKVTEMPSTNCMRSWRAICLRSLSSCRLSYTVPLPKEDNTRNTVDSYRGISISAILSKNFEQCVLTRYSKFLSSSPNQFGFKKGSSCGHAIYSVRKVVEYYINGGSTVNVCLLDLSKAFDKMNHFALYIISWWIAQFLFKY